MDWKSPASRQRFTWFAWAVLVYNIPVILWGAYVRVSFSGDGCGANWPTCNGQVLPQQMSAQTLIEFTHRMMTSVDSMATIALCIWAFLAFAKPHAVRRFAAWSLVFLLIEALLGAGLVLLRKVAHDDSAGRIWYLSGHLMNTMLLLGALAVTAWLAHTHSERIRLRAISGGLKGALMVAMGISITGVIAALGDTLFPASSVLAGMQQDFSSTAHILLRLRLLHPALAILGAGYIIWMAAKHMGGLEEGNPIRKASARVIVLVLFQIALGALNLSLLAPVWMQLIHLLVADVVWLAILVLALETARAPRPSSHLERAQRAPNALCT